MSAALGEASTSAIEEERSSNNSSLMDADDVQLQAIESDESLWSNQSLFILLLWLHIAVTDQLIELCVRTKWEAKVCAYWHTECEVLGAPSSIICEFGTKDESKI